MHLDLEPDLDDWCRWAVKAQVRPEIIAFLRFKPDLLHTADATSDANAWPTPRSWEMASHVLCGIARRQKTQFLSGASEFEAQLLDGTVGPAAASELVAFIRLFRQLPSIDEILLNPDDGAASDGAFRANRHCYGAGPGHERQLGRREDSRISTGCRPRCA